MISVTLRNTGFNTLIFLWKRYVNIHSVYSGITIKSHLHLILLFSSILNYPSFSSPSFSSLYSSDPMGMGSGGTFRAGETTCSQSCTFLLAGSHSPALFPVLDTRYTHHNSDDFAAYCMWKSISLLRWNTFCCTARSCFIHNRCTYMPDLPGAWSVSCNIHVRLTKDQSTDEIPSTYEQTLRVSK